MTELLLLSLLLLLFAAPLAAGPAVIAHRGASAEAPENTLAAVKLAWQQGADAVEVDVYCTADGQIVCSHDGSTKRTAGVDLAIAQTTFAELRKLDVGKWKGPQWAGERIPTLAEVLDTIPAGKRLFVEIKSGPDTVPDILAVLRIYPHPHRLVGISFGAGVIEAVREQYPRLYTCFLCAAGPQAVEQARKLNAHGLDVQMSDAVNEGFAQACRAAGLGLYVWTVDDLAVAKRAAGLGVDGITTNRPAEIMAGLGR